MIVDSTVTGSWSSSPDGIFNGYLNGRVDGLVVLRIIDTSNGGSEDIGEATGTISESGDPVTINGTFDDSYGKGIWTAVKTDMPAWVIGDLKVKTEKNEEAVVTSLGYLTSLGYTRILGNLIIVDSSLTDLSSFNTIERIDGSLAIKRNNQLLTLDGMNNLTTIGGILDISSNDILEDLSWNLTAPEGPPPFSIGSLLTDEDDPKVLKIRGNDKLTDGDAIIFAETVLDLVETQYNIGKNAKD